MDTFSNAAGTAGTFQEGPFSAVEVIEAGSDAAIIFDSHSGSPQSVKAGAFFEKAGHGYSRVKLVGSVSVRVYGLGERGRNPGIVLVRTASPDAEGRQAVAVGGTQVLAAKSTRSLFWLQNTGAVDLYVSLTNAAPTAANCSQVLGAASAADKGDGGTFSLSGYTGPVYVGAAGAGGQIVVGAL